jgi:hypothetical protein
MNANSSEVVQTGGRSSAGGVTTADYRTMNGAPVNGAPGPMGSGAIGPPPGMTGVGVPAGVVAGVGFANEMGPGRFPAQRTSVRFLRPEGMKVSWYVTGPDGRPTFTSTQLDVPGRYNFTQGAIYRLKLTHLPNRPNVPALYPTLEVAPATNKTAAFLAHSSVPVIFTEEDFDQILAGNYLVKVIYLPDPQFQDVATAGPDEIVSTRLDPGVNPVTEAMRRGSILLIIRVGNIDLEAPNTPALEAPNPYMNMMPPMAPHHAVMPPGTRPPANLRMAPQSAAINGPTPKPVLISPVPMQLTPIPPANSGPSTGVLPPPPDAPSPVNADSQSAVPAPSTSQDPPGDSGFGRRPLSLRRRILSGSTPDGQ